MTWNCENSNKPLEQMEPDHFLDQLHKIRQLLNDVRRNDTDYSDSTGQDQDNTRRVGDRRLNKANNVTLLALHNKPAHTCLRHVPATILVRVRSHCFTSRLRTSRRTKFSAVTLIILTIITVFVAHYNVYVLVHTHSEANESPQKCRSSVCNLLHVTLLGPQMWRRLLDACKKFYAFLFYISILQG